MLKKKMSKVLISIMCTVILVINLIPVSSLVFANSNNDLQHTMAYTEGESGNKLAKGMVVTLTTKANKEIELNNQDYKVDHGKIDEIDDSIKSEDEWKSNFTNISVKYSDDTVISYATNSIAKDSGITMSRSKNDSSNIWEIKITDKMLIAPKHINQVQVIYSKALEVEIANGMPWIAETHLEKANGGYVPMVAMTSVSAFRGWWSEPGELTQDNWNEKLTGITTLIGSNSNKHYYSVQKGNMSEYVNHVEFIEDTNLYVSVGKGNLLTIHLDGPENNPKPEIFTLTYNDGVDDAEIKMSEQTNYIKDSEVTVADAIVRDGYDFLG